MVAVVVVGGHKRRDRRKHLAPDAQRFQPLGIVPRQGGKLTGTIVHHPHIHTAGRFAGQHLQDAAPHEPFVDDEVFQKDVMLRRFQLAQQLGKLGLATVEVGHSGIAVHREAAAPPPQVARQRSRSGAVRLQTLLHPFRLGQLGAGLAFQIHQALFQGVVADVRLGVPEQRHAQHRQHCNDHQPGDPHAVVHVDVEQVDHHGSRDQRRAAQVMGQQLPEPAQQAEQCPELQQQQHQHQPEPAEDGVYKALLPLFEQTDSAVLKHLYFFFHVLLQLLCLHPVCFLRGRPPAG